VTTIVGFASYVGLLTCLEMAALAKIRSRRAKCQAEAVVADIFSALRAHQRHKPLIRKTFSRSAFIVARSEFQTLFR
jgi:hypothetical protein